MENVFLKLVNLSLTASILVLAVLVLRLFFRKAPKWLFCVLWGLVAVRLVCPFSLESALSLIPSAEPLPAEIITSENPVIDSGIPAVDRAINPILSVTFTPKPGVSESPARSLTEVLSWVWAAGAAAMLCYVVVSTALLKKKLRTATPYGKGIKQSGAVESPFVLGIIRPVIYLSYRIDGSDISYVISHEQAHIRRGDHIWKPLGFLILSVYWFNPLIWLAYILLCRDIEAACDEKVIKKMNTDELRAYSRALLNCSVNRRMIAACPIAFGEVGVKERIGKVMNYKKPAFWIIIAAVLACIAAAVCFLTNPKRDISDIPPADTSGQEITEQIGSDDSAASAAEQVTSKTYSTMPPIEPTLADTGEYLHDEADNTVKIFSDKQYDELVRKREAGQLVPLTKDEVLDIAVSSFELYYAYDRVIMTNSMRGGIGKVFDPSSSANASSIKTYHGDYSEFDTETEKTSKFWYVNRSVCELIFYRLWMLNGDFSKTVIENGMNEKAGIPENAPVWVLLLDGKADGSAGADQRAAEQFGRYLRGETLTAPLIWLYCGTHPGSPEPYIMYYADPVTLESTVIYSTEQIMGRHPPVVDIDLYFKNVKSPGIDKPSYVIIQNRDELLAVKEYLQPAMRHGFDVSKSRLTGKINEYTDSFFENGYLIAVLHTAAIGNQSIEFSAEKENNAVNVSLEVKKPFAATTSLGGYVTLIPQNEKYSGQTVNINIADKGVESLNP